MVEVRNQKETASFWRPKGLPSQSFGSRVFHVARVCRGSQSTASSPQQLPRKSWESSRSDRVATAPRLEAMLRQTLLQRQKTSERRGKTAMPAMGDGKTTSALQALKAMQKPRNKVKRGESCFYVGTTVETMFCFTCEITPLRPELYFPTFVESC